MTEFDSTDEIGIESSSSPLSYIKDSSTTAEKIPSEEEGIKATVVSLVSSEVSKQFKEKASLFTAATTRIDKKLKEAETKTNEMNNLVIKLQDAQNKTTETLAVFAALFTFISVSFNLFSKQISEKLVIGLMLVLVGSLSLFVVLLDLLTRIDDSSPRRIVFRFVLLFAAMFLIWNGTMAIK